MAHIRPKNWQQFQHYKHRNPPWIRLYRTILDDMDFQCLPLASKALAPMLWLIASECEGGIIEIESKRMAWRLRITEKEFKDGFKPLIDGGFFEIIDDASNMLATCYYRDRDRDRDRVETEESRDIPYDELATVYNDTLGQYGRKVKFPITDKRKKEIKKAWALDTKNEKPESRTNQIEYWRRYFEHLACSDFVQRSYRGEITGPHSNWRANLEWAIREETWVKTREGAYD